MFFYGLENFVFLHRVSICLALSFNHV